MVLLGHFPDFAASASYAVPGNDALMRCSLPSVAAEFMEVIGWTQVETGNEYYKRPDYEESDFGWWAKSVATYGG